MKVTLDVSTAEARAAEASPSPKAEAKTARAARDFEGVLVRQLLAAAHIGGKGGEQGYGAMATEALATGIVDGGGLGLARQIEDALSRTLARTSPDPASVKSRK